MPLYRAFVVMTLVLAIPTGLGAQPPDGGARVAALEAELRAAEARVAELERTLATLAAAITELKDPRPAESAELSAARENDATEFAERILVTDLGDDERGELLTAKPELFLQTAYFAERIDGASEDDAALNFGINRMEIAWAGRVSERFGMGYELQFHPAADGSSEELINDAFVEYYPRSGLTLRAGQFIKPFGFDIQHSSAARESPERGIFAGYFFPGQRDRGIMLRADLGELGLLDGTTLYAAALNGNRAFADDNDELNLNLRLRHLFPAGRLAVGVSYQAGTQNLPPGFQGSDAQDAYGADVQFVTGRLGVRAEYVRGDTPSTLLGLEPEFAAAFVPGDESWGATALFAYSLSDADELYWRWDRFDNDPVTGENPRAFNVGYLRRIGELSRIGVDYQWKDDVTFNDDELNTQLSLRWELSY